MDMKKEAVGFSSDSHPEAELKMPGHIKLVKGAVDPDPTDFLWPTMDMKKEDQAIRAKGLCLDPGSQDPRLQRGSPRVWRYQHARSGRGGPQREDDCCCRPREVHPEGWRDWSRQPSQV